MKVTEQTVFVVDDDPAMRDALKGLLESSGLAAETFPSAVDFLKIYDPRRPGCLLLDLRMPGVGGLELQERLANQRPALPVIVITGHGDLAQASCSFRMGAVDFLSKPFDGEVLLQRIREAMVKNARERQAADDAAQLQSRIATLTNGERDVMALLFSGHGNKAIAYRLGIALRTVEDRRGRVMEKMQTTSLAELVRQLVEIWSEGLDG